VLGEQGVLGGVAIPERDLDEFPVEVPIGTVSRGGGGRNGCGNVHRSIISHVAGDGDGLTEFEETRTEEEWETKYRCHQMLDSTFRGKNRV
jgi:hypothetical protein